MLELKQFSLTIASPTLDRSIDVKHFKGQELRIGNRVIGKIVFVGTEPGGILIRGLSMDELFGRDDHEHS